MMNIERKKRIQQMMNIKYLFLIIIALSTGMLFGQGDGQHERVVVVKPYNPMVDDAFKINLTPVITDTAENKAKLTYNITPMKLSTDIEIAPIKAAKMSGMPQPELYRLFLKTGFGNYTTPYFEVFYNSLRSRKSSYGLHYKHLSSMGKFDDYAFPGYSENGFDVTSTLFGKNHIFSFKGEYERDVVHFYGRPDTLVNDTITDKELIKQRFHVAGFDAMMRSDYYGNDKLNHALGVKYRLINDLYSTLEHRLNITGGLDKGVSWFNFSRQQTIGIDAEVDFFNTGMKQDTTTEHYNQLLVKINPYIETRIKELDVHVGGIVGYESENNGTLRFFPDISLKISLKEQSFILMGGLDGNLERSSFGLMAQENPFIISNPELRNTRTRIRAYGGLRTALGSRINFTARVSSEAVSNLSLFSPDTMLLLQNRFGVIYDDGSILSVKGELTYQAAEKIKIAGRVLYQDYNLTTELFAWHKPAFTGGLEISYNMQDKFMGYAELSYLAGMKVKTWENGIAGSTNLKNILDINFGAEYRYSKLISAFLRMNNLAASRYYRWQHYPSQRFNMMLGITYAL
jgi:hypothetical protein